MRIAIGLLLGSLLLTGTLPVASLSPASAQPQKPALLHSASLALQKRASGMIGKLPLRFEANRGQTSSSTRFLARGNGYNLFLAPTEATFVSQHIADPTGQKDITSSTSVNPASVLRLQLQGANPAPKVEGLDALPGKTHYYLGNDPKQWHTNVSSYARVAYRGVYPGVDLVYYANQRQLEYDFVLQPKADPNRIRLSFEGMGAAHLDASGDLLLDTTNGKARWHKPVLYQTIHGKRQPVTGNYVLLNPSEATKSKIESRKSKIQIGFQVGPYDHTLPLVIDPTLAYSTYLGGDGPSEQATGIAVDKNGYIYVTGYTSSSNFPGASNSAVGVLNIDAFVVKLAPDGQSFVYAVYVGGKQGTALYPTDVATALAIDASGSAYITGYTTSADYPTSVNAFQTKLADGVDAFVTKLNSGGALVYSTYLGGSSPNIYGDAAYGIAVDSAGNAWVTGYTGSQDDINTPMKYEGFPIAGGGVYHTRQNLDPYDSFVTKVNAAGSGLLFSTYLAGKSSEVGYGVAVDSNDNAIVTGYTFSADFPTLNAFQAAYGGTGETYGNAGDAFIIKYDPNGGVIYSSYLGGEAADYAWAVAVDSSGNAYITGDTLVGSQQTLKFPTTQGAYLSSNAAAGGNYNWVAKVSSTGALSYSTLVGFTSNILYHAGIAVDVLGCAYITGTGVRGDYPLLNNLVNATGGSQDAVITKLKADGSGLYYSILLGGSGPDYGMAIAVDSQGTAYMAGFTTSTDFPLKNPIDDTNVTHGFSDYAEGIVAVITEPLPTAVDVSNQVRATRGGFRLNRATGHFVQTVTLTNLGQATINGPISLVLDNLSANAALFSKTGLTALTLPAGSPYQDATAGNLAAGASVTLTLDFINPTQAAITYSTRVLAGAGSR